MYEIKSPIWNGGERCIGIADFRIGTEGKFKAKIVYKRKDGTESHPGYYQMDCSKLRTYPVKVVGGGVKLHVAPIKDWEHIDG